MGIFIFLVGFTTEIAFVVFCIITKSNQQRVRNLVRRIFREMESLSLEGRIRL